MTQKELVLNHLKRYGNITSMEAIQSYSVTRLSEIIRLIKKDGVSISTKNMRAKNKFGTECNFTQYKLEKNARRN